MVEQLGARDEIPVADETCDVKQGVKPIGAQQQCSGTARRIARSAHVVSG
jgi:hypothetical protein